MFRFLIESILSTAVNCISLVVQSLLFVIQTVLLCVIGSCCVIALPFAYIIDWSRK